MELMKQAIAMKMKGADGLTPLSMPNSRLLPKPNRKEKFLKKGLIF